MSQAPILRAWYALPLVASLAANLGITAFVFLQHDRKLEVRHEVARLEASEGQLRVQVTHLEARTKELATAAETWEIRLKDKLEADKKVAKAEGDLERLRALIDRDTPEQARLEDQVRQARKQVDESTKQKQLADAELSQARANLKALEPDLMRLENTQSDLQKKTIRRDVAETAAQSAEAERAKLDEQRINLERKIMSLKQQRDPLLVERADIKEQINRQRETLRELEGAVKESQENRDTLKKSVDDLTADIKRLQKEKEALQNRGEAPSKLPPELPAKKN